MFQRLAFGLVLAFASPAHAEDWLALYPECGFGSEARALGRMAMIYPRPGLPAVVETGERLVTRVRVPSGLTPPPGIQKDRALRGWSAELVGQSTALGGRAEHRYRTRVVDVRPDGQSTLVYRASIEVPRWAAPGTYGLRLSAPGGADAVAGAVRIVPAGSVPTMVLLPAEASRDPETFDALLTALSTAPYDVIVAEDARLLGVLSSRAPSAATPPILVNDPELPIALRVGSDALLFGACDDRYAPFDAQVSGLATREERTARPFAELISALDRWPVSGWRAPTLTVSEGAVVVEAPPDHAVETTIRYADDGRGVEISGARTSAEFYPAVSIPMTGEVRTLAVRVRLEAGQRATLTRIVAGPPRAEIRVTPESPVSGDVVHFTLSASDPPLSFIGWRLEEDLTFVGAEVEHLYRPVGEQPVHAFAITEVGVGAPFEATLTVKTREVRGCGGCGSASGRARIADLWLIGLVLLRIGIRRRNRPALRRR